MKQIKSLIVFGLIIYSLSACNKTSDRNRITKEQAKTILEESLSDSTVHNIIGSNTILTKKEKAIEFAEFILFDTYGKKRLNRQKRG